VQWRMQDFVNGEAVPFPRNPNGQKPKVSHQEIFQIGCVAIAIEKLTHRHRWKN